MNIDFDKVREARATVSSFNPKEYIYFMKTVHFSYEHKTKELTDKIVHSWRNDQSMKHEEFDAILEERKAEHLQDARNKRQADLQRIRDMKSRTGLDPLAIFPKEIWMMLLDQLLPEGRRNIRQVHEIFLALTEKTHIGDTLLPMFLCFLLDPEPSTNGKELTPSTLKQRKLVGKWRLVSKPIRNAIDHWFEEDLLSNLRNGSMKTLPAAVVKVDLLKKSDIIRFSRMKNSTKTHRFFTRSLVIYSGEGKCRCPLWDDSSSEDEDDAGGDINIELSDFPQVIDSILEYIGDQILYFSFEFHTPRSQYSRMKLGFMERYISLLGWLSKMPNLRWLKVIINQKESDSSSDFNIPEEPTLPFPSLKHLERLDLELKAPNSPNHFMSPFFDKILNAYSHVKILNLYGINSTINNCFVKPDSILDSFALETFSCADGYPLTRSPPRRSYYNYDSSDEDEDDDFDKHRMDEEARKECMTQPIFNMSWPLKCIDVEFKMGNQSVYPFLQSLEKFQSLEKIILSLKDVTIGGEVAFLKLPQLKHFEMSLEDVGGAWDEHDVSWNFFFSLQYLIYAKKLNTIIWKSEMREENWEKVKQDTLYNDNEGLGAMLDFGGGIWDISDGLLWRVFPWLDYVKSERIVSAGYGTQTNKAEVKEYRRSELDFSTD